ncbi:MAG TPA: SDR family oxidoreductase [Gemmatimonadota bacterium]|nr:SDR family oxidoreductase [Gemmatimonadota bacterium]
MSAYQDALESLRGDPRAWLVTGAAGFIGSGLVRALLHAGQRVVGLDNFATGKRANLEDVRSRVGEDRWRRFEFHEGDIRRPEDCRDACAGVALVLHQAALGSVPRSIEDPLATHDANVTGTVQMLVAARDAGVARFVFASSSSVYGDDAVLPKVEGRTGRPLSPYAVSKTAGERYLEAFHVAYGLPVVSLRYFNVFGPRQDPQGAYAAVIPRWIAALLRGEPVQIFGDGETSRDFCYLENAVQANLLAATTTEQRALGEAFNVAVGARTTLNELFLQVRDRLAAHRPAVAGVEPVYRDFRPGDVRHSLADVTKAERLIGYRPTHSLAEGLDEAMGWYLEAVGL